MKTEIDNSVDDMDLSKFGIRSFKFGKPVDLPTREFEFDVDLTKFLETLSPEFDKYMEAFREDRDLTLSESQQYIARLDYPTLATLVNHPKECADFLSSFLPTETLEMCVKPANNDCEWVINTIDEVNLKGDHVVLKCQAYKRQGD